MLEAISAANSSLVRGWAFPLAFFLAGGEGRESEDEAEVEEEAEAGGEEEVEEEDVAERWEWRGWRTKV